MKRPKGIDSGEAMRWNEDVERRRREYHEQRELDDRKDAADHRNDITWLVDRIESLGWEVTLRRRNR